MVEILYVFLICGLCVMIFRRQIGATILTFLCHELGLHARCGRNCLSRRGGRQQARQIKNLGAFNWVSIIHMAADAKKE